MKSLCGISNREKTLVAPRVGAWIEIQDLSATHCIFKSLPVWERGLKLESMLNYRLGEGASFINMMVAPRVGAWIEIAIRPS